MTRKCAPGAFFVAALEYFERHDEAEQKKMTCSSADNLCDS